MTEIETKIFHSYFAYGLIKNGYKGVKLKNPDKAGTVEAEFDQSECDKFILTYDKENCLNPTILIEYIRDTQKEDYDDVEESCGAATDEIITKSVVQEREEKSVLEVLKNGFDIKGQSFRKHFEAFAKKPTDYSVGTREHTDYEKNQFWCIHEFCYSVKSRESIDFAIFVNGLPVFDFELKTRLASSKYTYADAVKQYEGRVKSSKKGDKTHKYWDKKMGMMVHFAVDDNNIYVCTDVKEENSRFRPFNRGIGYGISKRGGNPIAKSGFSVEYLYQEFIPEDPLDAGSIDNILSKEHVNDIVKHYMHYENNNLIFPRFHQLNAVTRLEDDIKVKVRDANNSNENYLIQHSAGSGKTKSIAWLTYKLQAMKQKDGTNLFGSILIITDRKVVIEQLSKAIWDNDKRDDDMVARIELSDNKSNALKEALKNEKRIITCTIQSFLSLKSKLDFDLDKKYLVIIDESHSSTDGKDIEQVKASIETVTGGDNLTLIGFTATPKKSTLMNFGSHFRTYTDDKGKTRTEKIPFDVYSMRQAVEEGYILDAFAAYKTLEAHCQLVLISDDKEVEKNYAQSVLQDMKEEKGLNITNKVDFIIKDFYYNFDGVLDGEEKAMILADTISEAVEFFKIMKEKLAESTYAPMRDVDVLIAFSGKDGDGKTENDYNKLTPLPNQDIILATFDKNKKYKFLIVVNKYQAGYDQPKLCAMYVDKDLESDVQIVQTLSRVNRPYYTEAGLLKPISIVDFRNKFGTIKKAFSTFYEATYLSRLQVTVNDLEAIYQRLLSADVLSSKMFDDYKNQIFAEISKVGQEIERDKNSGDATLIAKADKNISNIYSYIRMYVMLMEDSDERVNIIGTDYETAYSCLERMKNFISSLVRPTGRKREAIVKDVGQFVTGQKVDAHDADKTLTAHGLISQGYRDYNVGPKDDKEKLSILIKEMNGIDEDSVSKIVDLLSKRRQLRNIANNTTNSKHDFSVQFQDFFLRELDDLDYNDEIDNDKYNELYHNWEQISDLVYDKIKNTKG